MITEIIKTHIESLEIIKKNNSIEDYRIISVTLDNIQMIENELFYDLNLDIRIYPTKIYKTINVNTNLIQHGIDNE